MTDDIQLTPEQEECRDTGLRMLARIIARSYMRGDLDDALASRRGQARRSSDRECLEDRERRAA